MFSMPSEKSVKRILIISLSNIGDVLLSIPVIGAVRRAFPSAEMSVLVGGGTQNIFLGDARLREVIPYDKNMPLLEKWRFFIDLRRKKYDLVVDLRNTLLPLFLGARYHTPLFRQPPRQVVHRMDRHLWKVRQIGIPAEGWNREDLWIEDESEKSVRTRMNEIGLGHDAPYILLAPGSKSDLKRWTEAGFAALSDRLSMEKKFPLLFVGDVNDEGVVRTIASRMREPSYSLVGKTSLSELAVLIRQAKLLVTNDSAPLHFATLLETPTVALFGPTDPEKYGPRQKKSRVVRKTIFCSPCEKARCPFHHECMEELSGEEVYQACCELL